MMAFDVFVATIQAVAVREGWTLPGVPYCDAEAWREQYDEAMTPDEAWDSERDAAASTLD